MKSKEKEKEYDKEFDRMGIRTRTYHFMDIIPFRGVTVVTGDTRYSWTDISEYIWNYTEQTGFNPATQLLERLAKLKGIYGVAICNERDEFIRREGREKAKRRLLRYLKHRI